MSALRIFPPTGVSFGTQSGRGLRAATAGHGNGAPTVREWESRFRIWNQSIPILAGKVVS